MYKFIFITTSIFFSIHFCKAQTNIDRAKTLLEKDSVAAAISLLTPVDKFELVWRFDALTLLGKCYAKDNNIKAATETYLTLLELSQKYFAKGYEMDALFRLARLNAMQGHFQEAINFGERGSQKAELANEKSLEFSINNILSWAYFEQNIDFNKVLIHEKRQYNLVNQIGNETQKALVYNNLGYDLTVAGTEPLDSAISLMKYANQVYAKEENNNGRWYTLMNLTWQHRLKGEFEAAIEYGVSSLTQAQRDGDRHAIIEASFQLGESLIAAGRKTDVATYYSIGLEQSQDKEDRDKFVFDVYYSRYLWETNNSQEAITRLTSAIEFLQNSEVFYEMHGRALLASYYAKLDRFNEAEEQLNVLSNPRHNYIALETKFIAAKTQAEIWQKQGKAEQADLLMNNMNRTLNQMGYYQYADL